MILRTKALIGATAMFGLAMPALAQEDAAMGAANWTGPYVGGSLG